MPTEITEITFRSSSNIFINAGILGLYKYVKEYKADKYPSLTSNLIDNQLTISCDEIIPFLEDVYYYMGKQVYDCKSADNINYYFLNEGGNYEAIEMKTLTTYGIARLINDNPSPKGGKGGESKKLKDLWEEDEDYFKFICNFYLEKGETLKHFGKTGNTISLNEINKGKVKENKGGRSIAYLNTIYTKIPDFGKTKFDIDVRFLSEGKEKCPLINENFKELLKVKNTNPFLRNIKSFTSFNTDQESTYFASFKAIYLSRFLPANSLYYYDDRNSKKHTLHSFFFNTSNLNNDFHLYNTYIKEFELGEEALSKNKYFRNFGFYRFGSKNQFCIYKHKYELIFMLIYTLYVRVLAKKDNTKISSNPLLEVKQIENTKYPIVLHHLYAEGDSKTMRVKSQEQFSNINSLIQHINKLERKGVLFKTMLKDLLFIGKDLPTNKKKKIIEERTLRNKILKKFLSEESFLPEMVELMFRIYNHKGRKYRNYWMLEQFTLTFDRLITENNSNNMNESKTIEEKAITAGYWIAANIISSNNANNSKKENAVNAKKYLIQLRKANDFEQFSKALERIMFKYNVQLNDDVQLALDSPKEQFLKIKHHILLKALSTLNKELNPISNAKNEDKNGQQ